MEDTTENIQLLPLLALPSVETKVPVVVKQIEMDTLLDTLDTGHTDPLFHSQLGDLTRSPRTHNITIKITNTFIIILVELFFQTALLTTSSG